MSQNGLYTSSSEQETAKIAADLAVTLKNGDIICLHGTLGMGKSLFARALIRTMCEDEHLEVPSPTFTLVQIYDAPALPIWHFDLYRLKEPDEIYELGWEEAQEEGVMLIEWPERLGNLKPAKTLDITFSADQNDPNMRHIEIKEGSRNG